MAAPRFVPVVPVDAYRDGQHLPPALAWSTDRPAEIRGGQPSGRGLGSPGPDQGYALKLANMFHGKLRLSGEHEHDVMAGCLAVAMKRAALFGRAPVVHDLDVAFSVFGFLGDAPPAADLVARRTVLFEAAGHHYDVQREIADLVPESTLRLAPSEVRQLQRVDGWKSLLAD
jgi:hypothetical protein